MDERKTRRGRHTHLIFGRVRHHCKTRVMGTRLGKEARSQALQHSLRCEIDHSCAAGPVTSLRLVGLRVGV